MAELNDIQNEFIREEIEEFLERPDEIERIIGIFAQARPAMQDIAAALIAGVGSASPARRPHGTPASPDQSLCFRNASPKWYSCSPAATLLLLLSAAAAAAAAAAARHHTPLMQTLCYAMLACYAKIGRAHV